MRIKEVLVVEGKRDTAKLKAIFGDVDTIETNGSEISVETLETIKIINEKRGVIILTDPDFPGERIRNIVQQYVGNCKHAFVDKKFAVSKNKVGIAETTVDELKRAIAEVVTYCDENDTLSWEEYISTPLMYDRELRIKVYQDLHIGYGNNKQLFKRLNMLGVNYQQLIKIIKEG